MNSLFDVSGRVAVITGGMGQLGVGYVRALVEKGAKVAVFDLATIPKTHHEWFGQMMKSGELSIHRVDVTDRSQIEEAAKEILDKWRSIDILINSAALDSPPDAPEEDVGPFETYPESSFDQVINVNIKGVFLCNQVIGRIMAKQKKGGDCKYCLNLWASFPPARYL